MPEHGEADSEGRHWFCAYWMDLDEWNDVHDYSPPTSATKESEPHSEIGGAQATEGSAEAATDDADNDDLE